MAAMNCHGARLPHQAGWETSDALRESSGVPPAAPQVVVEVLALRRENGCWSYRRSAVPLAPRTDPDSTARAVARVGPRADVVLHSTSWRYEPSGTLILTYALLPDPDSDTDPDRAAAEPLRSLDLARGAYSASPAPAHISVRHVAAHALRHLALLAHTDPMVSAALGRYPGLTDALSFLTAEPAGQLIATR